MKQLIDKDELSFCINVFTWISVAYIEHNQLCWVDADKWQGNFTTVTFVKHAGFLQRRGRREQRLEKSNAHFRVVSVFDIWMIVNLVRWWWWKVSNRFE